MGCGGSRAAAIEPRYYESWTRETESTWLTNTDTETPQLHQGIVSNNIGSLESAGPGMKENAVTCTGKAEGGRQAQLGASASLREKRMVNTGTQCGKQPVLSTSSVSTQRRPVHREETKQDARRMSSKDVAGNITKSIQQVSRGDMTPSCVQ
ncbi:brain and acute leukemia cytoplasmic protein-like [Anguilla anguilla]|uniref:brain and acute leukemia cytoplasmic protein-like n=1 Tax=Anguilla anguilla TaxID=7936 RepID=UPI0015A895E6|nr:brain and acute leukemia cytoplasmic protein-like [Anguilla anguilla]